MQNNYSSKKQATSGVSRYVLGVTVVACLLIGFFLGGTTLGVINFFSDAFSNSSNTSQVEDISELIDEEYFTEILEIFKQEYISNLDSGNSKEYTYGFVKGFIESLDDRYTAFLTPEEAKVYKENRRGDFEGVGIVLATNGEYTYIETVMKGNPAEKAGLLPSDIIFKIDGTNVYDKTPQEIAGLIRGEKGTKVKISVIRANEEKQFEVTRQKILIDNIQWSKINENTVKIDIYQFSDETLQKFLGNWDKVVSEIDSQVPNTKNVIVDLRNNPGGYVSGVQYILEDFLPTGKILFKESSKTTGEKVYTDKREGAFENSKVIVLVNQGSASASEIFSAAIQDNNRGEVVGMPTVGKGVEQKIFELQDGSMLLLVFQQWLTPNGNQISEESPIKPDYEVDVTQEQIRKGDDPQLDKAKELL